MGVFLWLLTRRIEPSFCKAKGVRRSAAKFWKSLLCQNEQGEEWNRTER